MKVVPDEPGNMADNNGKGIGRPSGAEIKNESA